MLQFTPTPRLIARFWSRVDRQGPNDCWPWMGALLWSGYGRVAHAGPGGYYRAHRVAYWLLVGEIPECLVIDHLCRNRLCCNPAHMEPVTIGENVRRGDLFDVGAYQRAKTHCIHGHAFSAENTHIGKTGKRRCRECSRLRDRGKTRMKHYAEEVGADQSAQSVPGGAA